MAMHYPDSFDHLEQARKSLVYEELFFLNHALNFDKKDDLIQRDKYPENPEKSKLVRSLIDALPFNLTIDQTTAINDIISEFTSTSRGGSVLLQGDVGSGKTLVSLIVALCYVQNGQQVAIVAPTDVLARQHHET